MGSLVGGVLGTLGGIVSGNKAAGAAREQAAALREAGNQAFESSRFRPVGITTRFGSSNFTVDPKTGALTGAGYTASPEIAAIQDRLMSQLGGAGFDISNQTLGRSSRLFGLGEQLLPTTTETSASPEAMAYATQLRGLSGQVMPTSYDPTAAAQKYVEQQQGLLQPGREKALSGIRQNLFNTGRAGLAVAQGGNLAASNPEMQAYYNAMAQQDAQLAAQGTQMGRQQLAEDIRLGTGLSADALSAQQRAEAIARQNMLGNIEAGTGLFGRGVDLATAGYRPMATQFDFLKSLESSAQQPLTLGMDLGNTASSANRAAAQLRLNPQVQASDAQRAASSWSPWGAALSGLGSTLGGMSGGSSLFGSSGTTFSGNSPAVFDYAYGGGGWY